MKLKMRVGNFDGRRQGLVIAATKKRAREVTERSVTECSWSCHHWMGANEKSVPPPEPPPEPPTRNDLAGLLRRWRDLDATPAPDEGAELSELAERDAWNRVREALADETDRAIAAEACPPEGDA